MSLEKPVWPKFDLYDIAPQLNGRRLGFKLRVQFSKDLEDYILLSNCMSGAKSGSYWACGALDRFKSQQWGLAFASRVIKGLERDGRYKDLLVLEEEPKEKGSLSL